MFSSLLIISKYINVPVLFIVMYSGRPHKILSLIRKNKKYSGKLGVFFYCCRILERSSCEEHQEPFLYSLFQSLVLTTHAIVPHPPSPHKGSRNMPWETTFNSLHFEEDLLTSFPALGHWTTGPQHTSNLALIRDLQLWNMEKKKKVLWHLIVCTYLGCYDKAWRTMASG